MPFGAFRPYFGTNGAFTWILNTEKLLKNYFFRVDRCGNTRERLNG